MTTTKAGSSLYTEIDADNIAWLHFDTQGSSTNVLSASLLEDFYKQLLDLEARSPRGLVIVSDKPNGFIAGADVREFTRIENRAQALDAIQRGQAAFDHLAALPFPTVAVLHGFCLGGGLELALACRYRIARDDSATPNPGPHVCPSPGSGYLKTYAGTANAQRDTNHQVCGYAEHTTRSYVDEKDSQVRRIQGALCEKRDLQRSYKGTQQGGSQPADDPCNIRKLFVRRIHYLTAPWPL